MVGCLVIPKYSFVVWNRMLGSSRAGPSPAIPQCPGIHMSDTSSDVYYRAEDSLNSCLSPDYQSRYTFTSILEVNEDLYYQLTLDTQNESNSFSKIS